MRRILWLAVLLGWLSGCATYRAMKEESRRQQILRQYLLEWSYPGPEARILEWIHADVDRRHHTMSENHWWYRGLSAMAAMGGGWEANSHRTDDGAREIESPNDIYVVRPAEGGRFQVAILDKGQRWRDYVRELEFLETVDPAGAKALKEKIHAEKPKFAI